MRKETVLNKGKRLGRYLLLEPIGEGSEGRVYVAQQLNAAGGLPCVIKLAHEDTIHSGGRKRFIAEARRAMQLGSSCPAILSVIDADIADGIPFFAMEYNDGTDLERILAHRREHHPDAPGVPLVEMFTILEDIANGLDFAHARRKTGDGPLGLVHRDIKPANTLVTFEGYSKLLDFGISTRATRKHNDEFSYGTPRYMSPEHIYGKVCPAMDMYSLGVLAWEMLEGRCFRGSNVRSNHHIAKTLEGLHPPFQNRQVAPQLVRLIEACLDSDPGNRPTAQEFHRQLKKCDGYESSRDKVTTLVREALGRPAKSRTTEYLKIPATLRDDEKTAPRSSASPTTPREPTMLNGDDSETIAWRRQERRLLPSEDIDDGATQLRRKIPNRITTVITGDDDPVIGHLPKVIIPPTEVLPARLAPTLSFKQESKATPHDDEHRGIDQRHDTTEHPAPESPPHSSKLAPSPLILALSIATAVALGAGLALWIAGA